MNKNINKELRITKNKFDNIFIVENRNYWNLCNEKCDINNDLILTVDFGLKHSLSKKGYNVQFLDHLVRKEILDPLNYKLHFFLNNWFKGKDGNDILSYNNFSLGDSILLYTTNDINFYAHYLFNILGLKKIEYNNLFVLFENQIVIDCLKSANIDFTIINNSEFTKLPIYNFPLNKWIDEKTSKKSISFKIKSAVASVFDFLNQKIDAIVNNDLDEIYIQKYHPTENIISELIQDKKIRVILQNYSLLKNVLNERRLSFKTNKINKNLILGLKKRFLEKKTLEWSYLNISISDIFYGRIELLLNKHLGEAIGVAHFIDNYFKKNKKLSLMIPITNYWIANRLLMNYCKNNKIPVFMIINGLLNVPFLNDGKDSDFVNCYSISIKEDYFENSPNAITLGDPRMDKYVKMSTKKINYLNPTIVIGAAGYDSQDLNSYIAFEFDFLFDILNVLATIFSEGLNGSIIIKVRSNGYLSLYKQFVEEYFYNLNIVIIQNENFHDLINKADLYISFYSQTIIEASCLKIPSIYYKKDTQTIFRPFDNQSELVTATSELELKNKILSFYKNPLIFEDFMQREILEKYIGPLDGNNCKRNLDFIKNIIKNKQNEYKQV
jgi:hypothetical protein